MGQVSKLPISWSEFSKGSTTPCGSWENADVCSSRTRLGMSPGRGFVPSQPALLSSLLPLALEASPSCWTFPGCLLNSRGEGPSLWLVCHLANLISQFSASSPCISSFCNLSAPRVLLLALTATCLCHPTGLCGCGSC
jgi:hypothetical protein